jgi:hypothetical protein
MTPEQKQWIDNASYADLLGKWRFASLGDSYFQGECGTYYARRMETKRMELKPEEQVAISKSIAW